MSAGKRFDAKVSKSIRDLAAECRKQSECNKCPYAGNAEDCKIIRAVNILNMVRTDIPHGMITNYLAIPQGVWFRRVRGE